jgi:hypothetical protein
MVFSTSLNMDCARSPIPPACVASDSGPANAVGRAEHPESGAAPHQQREAHSRHGGDLPIHERKLSRNPQKPFVPTNSTRASRSCRASSRSATATLRQ